MFLGTLEVQWFACYWKSRPYRSVWSLPSMVLLSWNSKGNSQANLCFMRFLCGSQLHLSWSNTCQDQNFDLNLETNELWIITHCSLFICCYTLLERFILRNSHNCGELISSISVGQNGRLQWVEICSSGSEVASTSTHTVLTIPLSPDWLTEGLKDAPEGILSSWRHF